MKNVLPGTSASMSPDSMAEGLSVNLEAPELKELVAYVAGRNPRGLRRLASRHGYPLQRGDSLVRFAMHFLREEGPAGFDALVREHPDFDLIVERAQLDAKGNDFGSGGFSGFAGPPAPALTPADWVTSLAYLAVHRRPALIRTLNAQGAAVAPTASDVEVAQLSLAMLQNGHTTLAGALTTLLDAPSTPWVGFGAAAQAASSAPLHPGWLVAGLFLLVIAAAFALRD